MSRKSKACLLFSAVLLWATWGSASVAIIQSKGCNATTCTFNFPTTSGNAILVAGATAGNSSNFTPTDNFSDIYVQDDRAGAQFWSKRNVANPVPSKRNYRRHYHDKH